MQEPATPAQDEFFFPDEKRKPGLVITERGRGALRPSQIAFNKAVQRLRKTREHLERQQAAAAEKQELFNKVVLPAQIEFNRARLDWILSACGFFKHPKNGLGPVQRTKFLDVILSAQEEIELEPEGITPEELEQLDQLTGELLGPDEDEVEDDDGDLTEEEINRVVMEMAEKMMRAHGFDVDLSGVDPDDFNEMDARVREAMGESGRRKRARKRSAKQIAAAEERERKAREKEQAKLRDFKSLFKSLAKAMHPDLVTDPGAKEHREQWMKRLTAAYEDKDLHAMLTIEMEWLGTESKDLEAASDEKLKMYTQLLREQTREVEFEIHTLLHADPLYYFNLSRGYGPASPDLVAARVRDEARFFLEDAAILKAGGKEAKRLVGRRLRELRRAPGPFYF